MTSQPVRFNPCITPSDDRVLNGRVHAPDFRVCPSCRGRKVDRFDFDCTTCLGEGTVDE